ncbi:MAG: hypothetical protein JKY32_05190 [Rhizobiales bacterium]|nr:hypothetical protein [Hyphomicrobiales bacterium]
MKSTFLTALVAVFLCQVPAKAEPTICVETEILAEAHVLVFAPWNQVRLTGSEVQTWLELFNAIPPETSFQADEVIFQDLGNGHLAILLSRNGDVCQRFAIDARIHLNILNEIARTQS